MSDLSARGLAVIGVVLVVLAIAMHLGIAWMFRTLKHHAARVQPPRNALATGHELPPEPRLQANPRQDLPELRARNRQILESYAWVDKTRGVARIPIERAMEILAQGEKVAAAEAPAPETPVAPGPGSIGMDQRLGSELPRDVAFVDELGQPYPLARAFGDKPIVLALTYYRCPNLCTLVLNGLAESIRQLPLKLGQDFDVVTLSIDPAEEPRLAIAKKRAYLARLGIEAAGREDRVPWRFLTGAEPSIAAVARAVGFRYFYDEAHSEYAHPAGLIVLTPQGKVSRYLAGIRFDPSDLRLALVEASSGRIGSPIDRLFLSCFHYDPATGRYGVYAMGLVRVLGTAFVAVFCGILIVLFRREREP